ncbi:LOW QUALITY PROTEIN: HMG domain-containing protein 3 [Pholidichthys leucotaenia]
MDKVKVFEVVNGSEELEGAYNQTEVTIPKKRKGKAQEDGGEKTKKPRSAYLLYYFDAHQIMQLGSLHMPQSEINKRISESWRGLSVAEKSYYLEKAKLEKEGMDTSSLSPSKDLPGFRKILPRASYFVLSKGSSSNQQPGGSQSEKSATSLDNLGEGVLPSVCVTQEPQFTPLGLSGGKEELLEHPDGVAEETTVASPSTVPSSSSVLSRAAPSSDPHVSQASVDFTAYGVTVKENETGISTGSFSGTVVRQIQGDTTQVVALIPTQNLLEPKSLVAVNTIGPVMMVPVGASTEQSAKPSHKRSVKTYTRRGRGRCPNPSCSFMYVTRHKPPMCPDCGSHLGGKWIPAAKRTQEKQATSKPLPLTTEPTESAEAAKSFAQKGSDGPVQGNVSEKSNPGQVQQTSTKQHGAASGLTQEGSSTKPQRQTINVKDCPRNTVVQGQDKGTAAVQKRPMRPILPACYNPVRSLFQIIAVLSEKGKCQAPNNKSPTASRESFSGLKLSTLKQLGQTVPTTTTNQDSDESTPSLTDRRMNILSFVPFKQNAMSSFDLGLSTARGRGHCKNPSCDYMYKNRHKPAVCPKCGCGLTQKNSKATKPKTVLDPYRALNVAQKDIQRQNTLQLLRSALHFPESDTELQETLTLIQELNTMQIVLVKDDQAKENGSEIQTMVQSWWPQSYESAATHCGLCNYPLFKGGQGSVAGQEDCWLLTEMIMQTVSLQLKVCLNVQCLALHSFTDLHPGLFNIGNRLLVSIDLFLKIRASIKMGQTPTHAARTLLDHVPNHPVHALSPDELCQIQELLLSGYWAFECLTVRDYNDMICGICGIAPKLEIAQRHTNNVLELKNVEFTWPEFSVSDEVHVDDFWLTMESEAIEQAVFPADIPVTRVDLLIAPFTPPLMRGPTVINTEKDKVLSQDEQLSGDPSVLVRLIHDGQLRLDKIEDYSEDELRSLLDCCGVCIIPDSTKNELLATLSSLYTRVHHGLSTTTQPPAHLTAGKLSKVCPHKVVCASKYLVRGETARDHVDLLTSSRYWPPVYVSDCARQVALCADLQFPELATQMWGRNQGCFCDPFEKAEFVSCAELQDHPYSADLSLVAENQQVHPITKSSSCWLVHPPGVAQEPPSPEHHSMTLCRELEPYVSLVTELNSEQEEERPKEKTDQSDGDSIKTSVDLSHVSHIRNQPLVFNNTAYYYLYNRLVDFLTSRDIVSEQINQVVKACQPGEVVIRDALYRLGVAQINTEKEEDVMEGQAEEEWMEMYEVVLPE